MAVPGTNLLEWTLAAESPRRDFAGVSSAVLRVPASRWEELGATFVATSDDPWDPERVATGSVLDLATSTTASEAAGFVVNLNERDEFGLLDDDDGLTTLLIPGEQATRSERASRILGLMAFAGYIDMSRDILQTGIGDDMDSASEAGGPGEEISDDELVWHLEMKRMLPGGELVDVEFDQGLEVEDWTPPSAYLAKAFGGKGQVGRMTSNLPPKVVLRTHGTVFGKIRAEDVDIYVGSKGRRRPVQVTTVTKSAKEGHGAPPVVRAIIHIVQKVKQRT